MAAHTILAVGIVHLELGVITVLVLERFRNLLVAIEALEGGRAGAELMAGIALRGAAQRVMGLREGTGRDLRLRGGSEKKGTPGGEDQQQDRSSESLARFAPRPQVRSTLAQEFLRNSAREKPTSKRGTPIQFVLPGPYNK